MSALEDSSHDQANQDERKQAEQLECHDIRFALSSRAAAKCLCSVGAMAMDYPPLRREVSCVVPQPTPTIRLLEQKRDHPPFVPRPPRISTRKPRISV
jgi:hypothetical protein